MARPAAPPAAAAHVEELAGTDLACAAPPLVRVLAARGVAVVLSRSRDPHREVHLEHCREDGVAVAVRPSGGGAVVLAPGVVVASVLAASRPEQPLPQPYFDHFSAAVVRALGRCGVAPVAVRGVSDLCLGERKVAGSSLRLWRGRVLYQVSLLLEADVSLLERYLPPPSRAPAYRRGRSHREFVTTLRQAGFAVGERELVEALRDELVRAAAE